MSKPKKGFKTLEFEKDDMKVKLDGDTLYLYNIFYFDIDSDFVQETFYSTNVTIVDKNTQIITNEMFESIIEIDIEIDRKYEKNKIHFKVKQDDHVTTMYYESQSGYCGNSTELFFQETYELIYGIEDLNTFSIYEAQKTHEKIYRKFNLFKNIYEIVSQEDYYKLEK